jgi:predicted nucleic acid-binding protein
MQLAKKSAPGELFQKTRARRKNRLDTMIAAAAILAGAVLATVNQNDFERFRAFGLKLYRFE